MKSLNLSNLLLSVLLITAPLVSQAHVIQEFPALDVQNYGSQGDTGAAYVVDTSLDVDSTAFAIAYDNGDPSTPIALTDFSLTTSSFAGGLFTGTFTIGTLLSGSFTDLEVVFDTSGVLGGPDTYHFDATFDYTGGSLAAGPSSGTIVGSIYSDGQFFAKVGEVTVVPVPAAIWLFASGLLGLVGVSRRKTA